MAKTKTKARPSLKSKTAEVEALPPVEMEEPLSQNGQWIGWVVWGSFVLVGFCFGVWAGTPRSVATQPEVAQAQPQPPADQQPKPPEIAKQPEPKRVETPTTPVTPPMPKGTEPTPTPPPMPVTPPPMPTVTPTPPEPAPKLPEPAPKPPEPAPKPPEPTPTEVAAVSYQKDIAPLFRTKCLNCHGGGASIKGGLDMKTIASMVKGGKNNGPGLTSGDLKKSSVWFTVEDDSMPEDKPLNAMEKKLIRDWILGGLKP